MTVTFGIPFQVHSLEKTLAVWSQISYIGHVLIALTATALSVI